MKKYLQDRKQTGPDNIPTEVLKRCDLDDILIECANWLLNEAMKPNQSSEEDILPLPKTGDLSETGNYVGISLSSIVAKIVSKMILNRVQIKMEDNLRPNQNGLRPGRSTASHILAVRRLIEGVHNRKAIIIYVDF